MNKANLLEVYCDAYRYRSKEQADLMLSEIKSYPIQINTEISEDAVRIRTAGELMAISRGPMSAGRYYFLENDIHLTHEWSPIDDFRGTFDGQGFTIHNLYVLESSARPNAGLFGSTLNATVRNVGVRIGSHGVTGLRHVGGLIGSATNTNVEKSSVIGNVNIVADNFLDIGGLWRLYRYYARVVSKNMISHKYMIKSVEK